MKKIIILITGILLFFSVSPLFSLLNFNKNSNEAPLEIKAAGSGQSLFNAEGAFIVNKSDIQIGELYNFFGYDWKVVQSQSNTITFWMSSPYKNTAFNIGNNIYGDAGVDTIWSNGYSKAIYKGEEIAESNLKQVLSQDITNYFSTQPGWDKVIPVSDSRGVTNVTTVYYRDTAADRYKDDYGTTLSSYFSIEDEMLWIPSMTQVKDGGTWGFTESNGNSFRNWTDTSISNAAWLRTPTLYSHKAILVGNNKVPGGNFVDAEGKELINDQSLFTNYITEEYGIRPAVTLAIKQNTAVEDMTANTNLIEGADMPLVEPAYSYYSGIGEIKYAITQSGAAVPANDDFSEILPVVGNLTAGTYTVYAKLFVDDMYIDRYTDSPTASININILAPGTMVTPTITIGSDINFFVGDINNSLISTATVSPSGIGDFKYAVVTRGEAAPEDIDYIEEAVVGNLTAGDYTVYVKYFINVNNAPYFNNTGHSVDIEIRERSLISEISANENIIAGSNVQLLQAPTTSENQDMGEIKYAVMPGSSQPIDTDYTTVFPTSEGRAAATYTIYAKLFIAPENKHIYADSEVVSTRIEIEKFTTAFKVSIEPKVASFLSVGESSRELFESIKTNPIGVGEFEYAIVPYGNEASEEDYSTVIPTVGELEEGIYNVYIRLNIADENKQYYQVEGGVVKQEIKISNFNLTNMFGFLDIFTQETINFILIAIAIIGFFCIITIIIKVYQKRS